MARYKFVESNYVKALEHGYIVEVQEISRIRDAGVLVGLNEYDRAGAMIPLVDGRFVRRHPDAMVVYTDIMGFWSGDLSGIGVSQSEDDTAQEPEDELEEEPTA